MSRHILALNPYKMSTAIPPHELNTEHENLTYLRAKEHMDDLIKGAAMGMKMLTKALDAMSCILFI